jgi:PIN domain nuclease of toxin-antitoxin system
LLFISAIVLWEIAIKYSLNRGDASDMPVDAKVAQRWFTRAGYSELAVHWSEAVHVGSLPPIHNDPFDRLLIAQTYSQDVWLLSADTRVLEYGGKIHAN